jgi:hypothetical protein
MRISIIVLIGLAFLHLHCAQKVHPEIESGIAVTSFRLRDEIGENPDMPGVICKIEATNVSWVSCLIDFASKRYLKPQSNFSLFYVGKGSLSLDSIPVYIRLGEETNLGNLRKHIFFMGTSYEDISDKAQLQRIDIDSLISQIVESVQYIKLNRFSGLTSQCKAGIQIDKISGYKTRNIP